MFDENYEVLQDYFPVERTINGEKQTVHVKPEQMTDEELLDLADRMRKAGESLNRHAEALRQDHLDNNA